MSGVLVRTGKFLASDLDGTRHAGPRARLHRRRSPSTRSAQADAMSDRSALRRTSLRGHRARVRMDGRSAARSATTRVARTMVSQVNAIPGSSVLDVASGTGLVARELAARNGSGWCARPERGHAPRRYPGDGGAALAAAGPSRRSGERSSFRSPTRCSTRSRSPTCCATWTIPRRPCASCRGCCGPEVRSRAWSSTRPTSRRARRRWVYTRGGAAGRRRRRLAGLAAHRQVPRAEHQRVLRTVPAAGAGSVVAGGRDPARADARDVAGSRHRDLGSEGRVRVLRAASTVGERPAFYALHARRLARLLDAAAPALHGLAPVLRCDRASSPRSSRALARRNTARVLPRDRHRCARSGRAARPAASHADPGRCVVGARRDRSRRRGRARHRRRRSLAVDRRVHRAGSVPGPGLRPRAVRRVVPLRSVVRDRVGAFPALTAYFAQTGHIERAAVVVGSACAAISAAQRVLSTPVRRLRRQRRIGRGHHHARRRRRRADRCRRRSGRARTRAPMDVARDAASRVLRCCCRSYRALAPTVIVFATSSLD